MSNQTHVQRIGLRRSTVAAAIVAAAIGLSAASQVAVGNATSSGAAVVAMPGGGCGAGGC
jgi:hypothetical protein